MMRQSFKTFKEKWFEVEKLLITAMLYSESLPNVQKYLDLKTTSDLEDEAAQ